MFLMRAMKNCSCNKRVMFSDACHEKQLNHECKAKDFVAGKQAFCYLDIHHDLAIYGLPK